MRGLHVHAGVIFLFPCRGVPSTPGGGRTTEVEKDNNRLMFTGRTTIEKLTVRGFSQPHVELVVEVAAVVLRSDRGVSCGNENEPFKSASPRTAIHGRQCSDRSWPEVAVVMLVGASALRQTSGSLLHQ